jgi:hypothetical protein
MFPGNSKKKNSKTNIPEVEKNSSNDIKSIFCSKVKTINYLKGDCGLVPEFTEDTNNLKIYINNYNNTLNGNLKVPNTMRENQSEQIHIGVSKSVSDLQMTNHIGGVCKIFKFNKIQK